MAYKVLAKSYLGYCKNNNTDDTYDNNTCTYYNLMLYTAHGAYSGSGSSCRNFERVVLVSCERIDRIPTELTPSLLDSRSSRSTAL